MCAVNGVFGQESVRIVRVCGNIVEVDIAVVKLLRRGGCCKPLVNIKSYLPVMLELCLGADILCARSEIVSVIALPLCNTYNDNLYSGLMKLFKGLLKAGDELLRRGLLDTRIQLLNILADGVHYVVCADLDYRIFYTRLRKHVRVNPVQH